MTNIMAEQHREALEQKKLQPVHHPPAGYGSLAADLLTGVAEIAEYTGQSKRRILYLIEAHGLPVFRRGRVIHARKHQVDAYFGGAASTQPLAEQGGRAVTLGPTQAAGGAGA
jgi:excisionase family DNA binding protein